MAQQPNHKEGKIEIPGIHEIPFLTIVDHADPSVGLFERSYNVECPVTEHDDPDEIYDFRCVMIAAFSELATGTVTATFSWENFE